MSQDVFELPAIGIEKENITPYLSILVVKKNGEKTDSENHDDIFELLSSETKGTVVASNRISEEAQEAGTIHFTAYNLINKPSWLSGLDVYDLERHVFVSLIKSSYMALYFSKKGLKDQVRDQLENGALEGVSFVEASVFNSTFVNEDDITTLWLLGIHGKDNYKAGNKVLGGGGVVDTLDPLLDQSYMMSAVRTKVDMDNRNVSIGVNPAKSSIWRGGCNTWSDFEGRVFSLLDFIENCRNKKDDPISFLSYPIRSCKEVQEAYDFSILDPTFLPEDVAVRKHDLLCDLWANYDVAIDKPHNNKDLLLDVFHKNIKIGFILVEFEVVKGRVVFHHKSLSPVKGKKREIERFARIFLYPDLFKIWFESGHAIVNGLVFRTGYTDVRYDQFIWADFSGYDVKREKPGENRVSPDLAKIGFDDSLFSWVKDRWSGCWSDPEEFSRKGSGKGWLYCDDGAGEKADFIHIVEFNGFVNISLIHVKSAKSASVNRMISVGAHDIVLSQAVKNIRYCVRKTLCEELKSRESLAEEKHCWLDGNKRDSREFIDLLNRLAGSSKIKTRVVVVQPHTTKTYYEKANTKIKNQLDVLLVSAQNSIRSANASFHIIGAQI